MKTQLISRLERDTIRENPNLTRYLENLDRDIIPSPPSWLYEHRNPFDVIDEWERIWNSLFDSFKSNSQVSNADAFYQIEYKQLEKIGPQGGHPPFRSEKAQESLEPIFISTEYDEFSLLPFGGFVTEEECYEFAQWLFGESKMHRMRPKSLEAVLHTMAEKGTLNTNSGYPRFTRRSLVQHQELEDAITGKAYSYPAILLFRNYYGKLRPVWMFPMSVNLLEYQFTHIIQERMIESPLLSVQQYLSPWRGFSYVKSTLTSQWRPGSCIVGGDTTKMDAHMRPAQMCIVFSIVKHLFQQEYWNDLEWSLRYINEIRLLVSPTSVIRSHCHGLASGSGWTQLTETLLQLFMFWKCDVTKGQGIGDDFYWIINASADDIVTYLGKFGLPANPSKQSISSHEVLFLQRLFQEGYFSRENPAELGAYYPTFRALNSMLFPEKLYKKSEWSKDKFAIRIFSILENCVDDFCFPEFCKFVAKGHPYLTEFAKKHPVEINRAMRDAKSVPGLFPSYNQEKANKPLSEYQCLQIIRSQ